MKSICIKSNNKYIIDYLLKDFSNIELDSIYLSNNSFKIYDNVIIHYSGNNMNTFYNILCDILTRCILFFFERKITKNILSYNYFYFNDLELKQILDSTIDLINLDVGIYEEKYNEIYKALYNYLLEHHSIVLNGFVNFRLKKYREILDYNVDLCVNNFLIEKEYYEFINILHLYVNSKESMIDTLHLVYLNKESILLDMKKISSQQKIIYLMQNIFQISLFLLMTIA